MITIDGSQGEGGGQILRTALGLSLVTGQSFRMQNIRAGRQKPGLLRQHLTAVEAATRIGNATVDGAVLGSKELTFKPSRVKAGEHHFSVGTAGSATLVLQTVLPALIMGSVESTLTLEGGTHNPHAPPFDFLERAFLPLVNRMGPTVSAKLERAGFYPAGGGRFSVSIKPSDNLQPLALLDRGEARSRSARAIVANLSRNVADRELKIVAEKLGWTRENLHVEQVASAGPGNALVLELASEHVTEVFTGFGERGVLAETVGEKVVSDVRTYLVSGAPVGEHLADQLLIPLALSRGGAFGCAAVSRHTRTNIDVIQKFLPGKFIITEHTPRSWRIHFANEAG
jgi:RNA 3'-terminal phosphate cyclase (ATP)